MCGVDSGDHAIALGHITVCVLIPSLFLEIGFEELLTAHSIWGRALSFVQNQTF